MIVYGISDDDVGTTYYARLLEARNALCQYYEDDAVLEKITLVDLPPRQLAVRLLNGDAFISKSEVLE